MAKLGKRKELILSYPKLAQRLKDKPGDKEKISKLLEEISDDVSIPTLTWFRRFLDFTLPKLYDNINFTPAKEIEFKRLTDENCVVLVPNHQSHADYIAISYCIFSRYKMATYVAGGKNLNIFPIGALFRKCGCFFIRRSFGNDILYKLTLEAYLYALLYEGRPIEFFFEGGRSRTGKLLPPRFGLYQMLLEAYQEIPADKRKKLVFVPVSVMHEYLAEQKSLARELEGGKKRPENSGQLLKLVNLFSKNFGSIHIRLGKPVEPDWHESDAKRLTQNLAFTCFRRVGANMPVTPTSLLCLVLLDNPSGALRWDEIESKTQAILDYCQLFKVPITPSLEGSKIGISLKQCAGMLRGNGQLLEIGSGDHVFFSIKQDSRKELQYFKNTILHHFLIPWIIQRAWVALFSGRINDVSGLKRLFLEQRALLKYEFYLPTVKELFFKSLEVISSCVGKSVSSLDECLALSHKELYDIALKLGIFSKAMNPLLEAYYLAALTVKVLNNEQKEGAKEGIRQEAILKKSREVFSNEMGLGRVIKYPETYGLPVMKNGLQYLVFEKVVEFEKGSYKVIDKNKLDTIVKNLEIDLSGPAQLGL